MTLLYVIYSLVFGLLEELFSCGEMDIMSGTSKFISFKPEREREREGDVSKNEKKYFNEVLTFAFDLS